MTEYSANAAQTVAPGKSIVFTANPVPCTRGFVRHRDDSGAFLLSGWVPRKRGCCKPTSAKYVCDFGANVAIPETGTPSDISVAIYLDGVEIPASAMLATPGAISRYQNISSSIVAEVWNNCCQTLTIVNTGTTDILVQNANVVFTRPDLAVTY